MRAAVSGQAYAELTTVPGATKTRHDPMMATYVGNWKIRRANT